jgi:hypothetical protein
LALVGCGNFLFAHFLSVSALVSFHCILACLLFMSIIYIICVCCAIGKVKKMCKKFLM